MRTIINSAPGLQTVIDLASDGTLTTGTVQDCTQIADLCQQMSNEGITGSSEMRHAAFIPDVFIEKYGNDRGLSYHEVMANKDHIRMILRDPALAHFRIWKGKV